MGEKEEIFSSKMKYSGLFKFTEFYKFGYEWLVEQPQFTVVEDQYFEKIKGAAKDIEFSWVGSKKVSDYFKYEIKVKVRVTGMEEVEVAQDKLKIKMNKGTVEVKITSSLIRDWQGQFEESAFKKFLRAIYEKWVISSRILQHKEKLVGDSDEFLAQIKAYLDLSGKR